MNAGNRLSVPQGHVLFRAGDACSGFVIVHSGTIKVSLTAENGREIILYRVRPGEICLQTFGCLLNHRPYHAEGMAETDLVIEIISHSEFTQRVSGEPDFRDRLFDAVASRFADMEQLVEDVALTGFTARLARCLLRLADSDHVVTATHESLATEMGSGRAAVSRGLGALARKGVITIERGRIR
ncbi:MAG: hypothetical protein RLZZ136_54, partial [Pseudomonadota bacterium]